MSRGSYPHVLAPRAAIYALEDALKEWSPNERRDLSEPYDAMAPLTWPSTISAIDTRCGGFYGMTVVAAEKGTGKSILARASAIEAAASGEWQVVNFVAENDYDGWRDGFNIYLDAHPGAEDCIERMALVEVGKGQTPWTITQDIIESIDRTIDLPVLVVLDSIDSIVKLGLGRSGSQGYLRLKTEYGLWAMFARRVSGGNASFLIVSETNTKGEAKGQELPSWADVSLKMKKCKGKQGASRHVVEMILDKTRRTGGEGPLGKYVRKYARQRFEPADAQPELTMIRGGAAAAEEPF